MLFVTTPFTKILFFLFITFEELNFIEENISDFSLLIELCIFIELCPPDA